MKKGQSFAHTKWYGTVVEYTTHNQKIEGSNPDTDTGRENMEKQT